MDKKINFNEVPDFEPKPIEMNGEKTTVDALLNKELAFLNIEVFPSSFYEGDFASVEVVDEYNVQYWFRTSSAVLIRQLSDLKKEGKLPVKSIIKKVKKYYTLAKKEN